MRWEGLGPRCSFSRNADELDGKDSSEFAPLGRFEATQVTDRTGPFAAFRAAFLDGRTTIDDAVAEGDTVVTRWTFHGTHEGEFAGIAPTGRRVTLAGINIDRIVSASGGRLHAAQRRRRL